MTLDEYTLPWIFVLFTVLGFIALVSIKLQIKDNSRRIKRIEDNERRANNPHNRIPPQPPTR